MATSTQPTRPTLDPAGIEHLRHVALPALLMGPVGYLDEVAARLAAAGVHRAVAAHDTAPIYDWLMTLVSLQGISDAVALGWDARHGGINWAEVSDSLAARPSCTRLRHHARFVGCGYRKGASTCAEPDHIQRCPLPLHPTRKGGLSVAAYSFALFVRDVCAGDFVAWLDASLAHADPGPGSVHRIEVLGNAVVAPLTAAVTGIGPKVWSLALAELLLGGDPSREWWVTAGAGMIAVDSLVHAYLHRTGTLRRCSAEHRYSPACYAPGGCAEILRHFAATVDAGLSTQPSPLISRVGSSTRYGSSARKLAAAPATAGTSMTAAPVASATVRPTPAAIASPSRRRARADAAPRSFGAIAQSPCAQRCRPTRQG